MFGTHVQKVSVVGVSIAASISAWLTCSTLGDWPIAVPPAMTTSAAATDIATLARGAPTRWPVVLNSISSSFLPPSIGLARSSPIAGHDLQLCAPCDGRSRGVSGTSLAWS